VSLVAEAALAAEANIWAMHRDFARITGAEIHDDPDVLWFTCPSPSGWLNGASWTRLSPSHADARIEQITNAIHGRGSSVWWHVTPSCAPPDLGRRLERLGFESRGAVPAMVADLDALSVPPRPKDLQVQAVATAAEVREWLTVFSSAFGSPPREGEHPWLQAFTDLARGDDVPCRLFIGRVGTESVGCSLALIGGGAVGLYGVGTVPEHRGKGFGSALTLAGMAWGRSRGQRLAILHATQMGEPVYAAIGFKKVWDKTDWLLRAPA
jgi:GNAT superfamily N-acetyltransferase